MPTLTAVDGFVIALVIYTSKSFSRVFYTYCHSIDSSRPLLIVNTRSHSTVIIPLLALLFFRMCAHVVYVIPQVAASLGSQVVAFQSALAVVVDVPIALLLLFAVRPICYPDQDRLSSSIGDS